MDMRSLLQIPKNVLENMTFKWGGSSVLPSVEISGKGLMQLHGDGIWVTRIVGDGFLKSRILWEDSPHEFNFVQPDRRGEVCRTALSNAAAAIRDACSKAPGSSSAHLAVIDLLTATEALLDVAARQVIVDRHGYNAWVTSTGGSSDEGMSENEHLAVLLGQVREVRKQTFPLWGSLIALLPPGAVQKQAEERFRLGSGAVGVDTGEVLADWVPVE
jgi:hypothetical protein